MKKILLLAIAAVLAFLPALAAAATGAVKLPPCKEYTLKNGLRVFVMETREVPLVTLQLLVPAGSAMDGPGAEGIANLTGRLLTKGAGGLTADQIAESIEEVGGVDQRQHGPRLRDRRTAIFSRRISAGRLDIMGKIVLAPDFPKEELRPREGARRRGDPGREGAARRRSRRREFVRVLVGDHPYAHPVDGSEESVGRDDARRRCSTSTRSTTCPRARSSPSSATSTRRRRSISSRRGSAAGRERRRRPRRFPRSLRRRSPGRTLVRHQQGRRDAVADQDRERLGRRGTRPIISRSSSRTRFSAADSPRASWTRSASTAGSRTERGAASST